MTATVYSSDEEDTATFYTAPKTAKVVVQPKHKPAQHAGANSYAAHGRYRAGTATNDPPTTSSPAATPTPTPAAAEAEADRGGENSGDPSGGAQPPPPKPPHLKPLHWDKLRAISGRTTVWDQVKNSDSFRVNVGHHKEDKMSILSSTTFSIHCENCISSRIASLETTLYKMCMELLPMNHDSVLQIQHRQLLNQHRCKYEHIPHCTYPERLRSWQFQTTSNIASTSSETDSSSMNIACPDIADDHSGPCEVTLIRHFVKHHPCISRDLSCVSCHVQTPEQGSFRAGLEHGAV
ncbi:hypothetical protein GUJ93_ZPchr0013g36739 [Zizania palustris]|uniref:Uncharacterized protein n=1 Tax=Zizania palustris TaxID=103762 RepID=A0A8J5X0Y7_ZIZPA|nr:hypothetical protein GUJ93_ZPchr0013g36739 [Zizania palustris]